METGNSISDKTSYWEVAASFRHFSLKANFIYRKLIMKLDFDISSILIG
jgi:hypothetical protein